jgi:hypothetical protein
MAKPPDMGVYEYTKKFLLGSYFSHPQINNTVAEIILKTFVNTSLPHDSVEFYKQCATVSLSKFCIFYETIFKALSDYMFNYPTYKMVNTRVSLGETAYLYYFTYFKSGTLGNTQLIKFKGTFS